LNRSLCLISEFIEEQVKAPSNSLGTRDHGSWRRDEKGGLPPLEKGVFVRNCAREKKKRRRREQARKGMANSLIQ
jgi:hypothetical protein